MPYPLFAFLREYDTELIVNRNKAYNQGHKVNYFNIQKLLDKLRLIRADGTIVKLITKTSKVNLLIIDDFGMKALEGQ